MFGDANGVLDKLFKQLQVSVDNGAMFQSGASRVMPQHCNPGFKEHPAVNSRSTVTQHGNGRRV
jgi:hypothetical protein